METMIYFFSGTGNSLYVAQSLATALKAPLMSIPKALNSQRIVPSDRIVIVFPAYKAHLFGVPLVVKQFVEKLDYARVRSIVAVCTCGGYQSVNALPALRTLSKIIADKGGKLTSEHSVRLPMNNLNYDHIPIPINKDNDVIFAKANKKLTAIISSIANNRRTRFAITKRVFNSLMIVLLYKALGKVYIKALLEHAKEPETSQLTFFDLMRFSDRSIYADESCIGCATCAKVCPVNNIQMIENRPTWNHKCEMCMACDEWCSKHAVHHWERPDNVKYHHPNISLSEMLKYK